VGKSGSDISWTICKTDNHISTSKNRQTDRCIPPTALSSRLTWSVKRKLLTASRPSMLPWSDPYLKSLIPPAFVDTFPPIWQLPLAPRSSGIMKPSFDTSSSSCWRTQPDWHVSIPVNTNNIQHSDKNINKTQIWVIQMCKLRLLKVSYFSLAVPAHSHVFMLVYFLMFKQNKQIKQN